MIKKIQRKIVCVYKIVRRIDNLKKIFLKNDIIIVLISNSHDHLFRCLKVFEF